MSAGFLLAGCVACMILLALFFLFSVVLVCISLCIRAAVTPKETAISLLSGMTRQCFEIGSLSWMDKGEMKSHVNACCEPLLKRGFEC